MDNYFEGYVRNDGTAGTRNYIGVVCSVICSSVIAKEISDQLPEAVPLIHSNGCAQLGDDFHVTKNMLTGVASNPNLYAALLVGLGCETNQISGLLDSIPKTKPIEGIGIQQLAGGENTINKGVQIAQEWSEAAERNRERLPLPYLSVGIVTVDMDEESLERVHPVVSEVVDRLVEQDAKVVMALTDRLEPAGGSLADRAENKEVKDRLSTLASGIQRKRWQDANQEPSSPRPFSDQEKALAALEEAMSGTSPLNSLLDYNERPEDSGLHFMKASSNLVETLSNMASCGCNIALVVSSRGVLTGSIALPCMTLTPESSSGSFDELVDYTVTEEDFSMQARKVIEELLEISSGKQTKLEEFGLGEFSIPHVGTTF